MQKGVSTTSQGSCSAGMSVGDMFDRIAPTYDVLNHVLSLGIDRAWRRKVAKLLAHRDSARVLDLATGTGDLLIAILRECNHAAEVVGLDVSEEMLKIGRRKVARHDRADRVRFVQGDAMKTSLPAASFDAVTMAFGIRNTPDVSGTLAEIHRLLTPGGTAAILEFSVPGNRLWRGLYLAYLRWAVPVIGALVSGHRGAYRYLNTSIEGFHRPDAFCRLMAQAGFAQVAATPLTWGVASLYTGLKAPPGAET